MEILMPLLLILVILIICKRHSKGTQPNNKEEFFTTEGSLHRGTYSERNLVRALVENNIPVKTIFHDLYFYNEYNGTFSQVDIAVLTKVGILVFEVKDYGGWIFGNGSQQKWTQVMSYGKDKFHFYNPIKQNAGHILSIKNQSQQLRNIPMFSIIVFDGDCVLKRVNDIPDNVYLIYPYQLNATINHIMMNNPLAPYTDKYEVLNIFRKAMKNGENRYVKGAHIDHLKNK